MEEIARSNNNRPSVDIGEEVQLVEVADDGDRRMMVLFGRSILPPSLSFHLM